MKSKIFITLFFCFAFAFLSRAQDVVRVVLNNKRVAEVTIPEQNENFVVSLYKKNYRNVKQLSIFINPNGFSGPFKRDLEITDGNENVLLTVYETKLQSRRFVFSVAQLKKIIAAHKSIKIYVNENPANPMMKIRSQRKFLVQLLFK